MDDKEKQIENMARLLCKCDSCDKEDDFVKYHGCTCDDYVENCMRAKTLYDHNYRKMDEVTLRIDLGDRTPEQINEIMEKFSKATER